MSRFGEGLKKILAEPNTGENTVNSPIPTQKGAGGITIAKELLPDVAVGDVVTMKVTEIDEDKGEIYLERSSEEGSEQNPEQNPEEKPLPETL